MKQCCSKFTLFKETTNWYTDYIVQHVQFYKTLQLYKSEAKQSILTLLFRLNMLRICNERNIKKYTNIPLCVLYVTNPIQYEVYVNNLEINHFPRLNVNMLCTYMCNVLSVGSNTYNCMVLRGIKYAIIQIYSYNITDHTKEI